MDTKLLARTWRFLRLAALALPFLAPFAGVGSARADILFQSQSTGQIVNWSMSGSFRQSFSYLTYPGSADWRVVGSGDFNGDQKPDLLFQNRQTGQLVYWIMNGTAFVQWGYINPSIPGPVGWAVVGVLDLNGDGKPDILFQNVNTGQLVYWLMNGVSMISYGYLADPGSPNWRVAAVVDINNDGHPDLLFQNRSTGQLVYWIMSGTSFVTYGYLLDPGSPNWQVIGTSEINNDSTPDLILQNQATGQLVYWIMSGANVTATGYLTPDNSGSTDWRAVLGWPVGAPIVT